MRTCIEGATKVFVEKGFDIENIKAVGLTNQRETTVSRESYTHRKKERKKERKKINESRHYRQMVFRSVFN